MKRLYSLFFLINNVTICDIVSKQVTYKDVRAIAKKTYKYIIRSYEPFIEERVRTLVQMISVVRKMKRLGFEYVIVKVPFRQIILSVNEK